MLHDYFDSEFKIYIKEKPRLKLWGNVLRGIIRKH